MALFALLGVFRGITPAAEKVRYFENRFNFRIGNYLNLDLIYR
jgi:hypothetical protein